MRSRRPRWSKLVAPFAATALLTAVASAPSAQELTLKLSREIEPPVRRGLSTSGAAAAGADSTAPRMIDLAGGALPQLPTPAQQPSSGPRPPEERGAIFLRADRLEGTGERRIEAAGHVELRTRRETVLAEWLQYDIPTDEIWGKGDVTLRRGLDWISGPEVKFYREREIGYFEQPRFYLSENASHGEAKEIRFAGPNLYEATDAQYTSCVAPNNDWYLRSDAIEVDQLRKVGTAHGAKVYFLGVPVMYTPWLEFPLSNERKSGFLTPTIGSTQIRGFEIATPYYFNLAPNYDATLSPRFMTRRGLQIAGQGRYLFEPAAGEAIAEVIDDRITDTTRWAFSWKHNQQFAPWLAGYVNYNRVSDATYLADYSDRVAVTSQKTLPEEAGLIANYAPFSVLARVQSFQTLQDPNPAAAVIPPYNMLPQVRAAMADTDWLGLTWNGTAEYVRFSQSALTPTGDRASFYPSLRWTRQGNAWFINAHAGIATWQYDLNQPTAGVPDGRAGLAVPITSVDAGLVFERDMKVLDTALTQTLEPRAFYVYIPYKDQSKAPVFDTALDDFNFSQLFAENRYIGNDRIGDANQLTLALTSRFLDHQTGAERLRLAVGQRFYFADQRVSLNEPLRSASSSDFLVSAEGRLSDAWSLAGLLQYNFDNAEVESLNLGVRYKSSPGRALNATWSFKRTLLDPTGAIEQIKQIDLSGQWPVSDRWTLIGRWNYSFTDRKTLEGIAGIEYNADCWVLRVVGQRLTTTTQQATTSVFVQLELNGLARVGTSPLELLRRSVPGYLPTNDPSLRDRDRRLDPLPEF